jgi:hypothetical protein
MVTDRELSNSLQDALTSIHQVNAALKKPTGNAEQRAKLQDRLDQAGAKIALVQLELRTR